MAPITPSNLDQEERGAALVEFALALPLLLVVIAGIVDFGFTFQRYEVVTNAVREGARMGTLPGYSDPDLIKARVREYVQNGLNLNTASLNLTLPLTDINVTNPDLTLTLPGGGTATVATVRVDAFYHHNFLLLGPVLSLINKTWGGSITLKGTSQMRLEVAGGGGS